MLFMSYFSHKWSWLNFWLIGALFFRILVLRLDNILYDKDGTICYMTGHAIQCHIVGQWYILISKYFIFWYRLFRSVRPQSFIWVGISIIPQYGNNFGIGGAGSARERSDSGRPAQKLSEGSERRGKSLPILIEDLRIDLYLWNYFQTHRSFARFFVDKARTQAVNH